jgi:diaminopimelate decarboxylase
MTAADVLTEIDPPAYVYDLDEVGKCYAALREALPRIARLYYSLKANPHPAIIRRLGELGCSAEVCSSGELATALDAGLPACKILYTGPGKSHRELTDALKSGVTWFSADSPRALDQVSEAAASQDERVSCLLRINDWVPAHGQGLAMTGVPSQFGADAQWVATEPSRFRSRPAARVAGFHLYMGSNLMTESDLLGQFATAIGTARRLAEIIETDPELVNLGGGFGAPFARPGTLPSFPTLSRGVAALLDAAFPGWRGGRPAIAFESGRYLTATCGSLVTRVADVKTSHGTPVAVLESGINHLGGMSGLRRLPPLVPELVTEDGSLPGEGGPPLTGAIVAGPLCTPLDTWAKAATLPAVRPGDLLVVPNVGAYGLTASLVAFLGHPMPREVVVDRGAITSTSQLAVIRLSRGAEEGNRTHGCRGN